MTRFIYKSDDDYKALKAALEDNCLRKYKNVQLPAGFNVPTCNIGIEKYTYDNNSYVLSIDFGITCNTAILHNSHPLFEKLLKKGELYFLDFNDLKVFLRSLSSIYVT